MNNEQLRNLFNKITSNGMREMTEERFIQAINEANEIEMNKKCDLKRHSSCGIPCNWFNEENGNCELIY
jgi:hypothetical protein